MFDKNETKEELEKMEHAVKDLLYDYQHTKIVQFLVKWIKQEKRSAFRNGVLAGLLIGLAIAWCYNVFVFGF